MYDVFLIYVPVSYFEKYVKKIGYQTSHPADDLLMLTLKNLDLRFISIFENILIFNKK